MRMCSTEGNLRDKRMIKLLCLHCSRCGFKHTTFLLLSFSHKRSFSYPFPQALVTLELSVSFSTSSTQSSHFSFLLPNYSYFFLPPGLAAGFPFAFGSTASASLKSSSVTRRAVSGNFITNSFMDA